MFSSISEQSGYAVALADGVCKDCATADGAHFVISAAKDIVTRAAQSEHGWYAIPLSRPPFAR